MSWNYQQRGGQWSLKKGTAEGGNGGILSRLSMSLDAVCYLVAFFLVDIFTFGRPLAIHTTPTLEKQESPIDTYVGHVGRSASEGDAAKSATSLDRISRRSSQFSESSSTNTSLHRFEYFSPERKSPRADYRDGALHHNQKAIFERQMQKTLRVQPYIKGLFIFAGFTGWFILFIHFFGLPPFLRIAIGQVRNFLFRMVALIKVQLFRIYRLVSAVLPVRSKKPTGWDVVKATWSRFWLQFLDHLTSFHR